MCSTGPDGVCSTGPDGLCSTGPDGLCSTGPDGVCSTDPDGVCSIPPWPRPLEQIRAGSQPFLSLIRSPRAVNKPAPSDPLPLKLIRAPSPLRKAMLATRHRYAAQATL